MQERMISARNADLLGRRGSTRRFSRIVRVNCKDSMTFFHYLEEALEDRMPFSAFTSETFALAVRVAHGQAWPVTMRLYDPVVSGRRDVELMMPHLKARGVWGEGTVGRLSNDRAPVCRRSSGRRGDGGRGAFLLPRP